MLASAPISADTARRLANCRRAARLAGVVSMSVGGMALLGWIFDIPRLRVLVPGYSAMVPNTALGLVLCGMSLWMDRGGQASGMRRRVIELAACLVTLIGLATLLQYILGRDLGIDGVIFPRVVMLRDASRMAAMSTVTFVLLGGALLLMRIRHGFAVGQYLVIAAGILCLFNAIGYLYGIRSFYGLAFKAGSTAMAIHASLTFVIICAGLLLSRPDWGLMATITSAAPGGVIARRLLPTAIVIPVSVGWLRWQGQLNGYYDTAFGLAISTSVSILIFGFMIWRSGQILNRLDVERVQAETKTRQLAESMPLMVWTTNPAGETDYFNQSCYNYSGMTFEQIRDGGWVATIHPEDVGAVMERRAYAFATLTAYTLEYRFKRASDGMYRWHLAQGTPILDSAGEIAGWVGTCTDIHSVKSAEEALRNSEAQFRQLADSMPQMVWTASPAGNIDYYNQGWYEYTGTTFAQVRDWGWGPVLHPDDLQNTVDQWSEAVRTCGVYEIEYRLMRADGVYRWHLGRASPVRDSSGAVLRWFGTCTDIEDYKQAERKIRMLNEGLEERVRERTLQLERSNHELQDFASVASHDLQEPLRKVQAFGDRLNAICGASLDTQARDYLNRMLNATQRMQSLIQDLLRFARITSQANPFLPVDLAQVVREVLCDLEVRIAETSAVVQVAGLPTIDADAVQMRQLFQNLIGNALKFHQQGSPPRIRVYAEYDDSKPSSEPVIRLTVEDNGIGFDEKYLDRIFTVFQRLHGRTEYAGTGVGLAICRKIAQRHGGGITATSAVDLGATFVVTLPVHHNVQPDAPVPESHADMNLDAVAR